MRAGAYSPNHIGNDAAIFNAAAEQLRKRGCVVNVYSEDQLNSGEIKEKNIMCMCREQRSIQRLQEMEDEGALVINSAYGIENCTRERMTRILLGSGIPYPESLIVNTNEVVKSQLDQGGYSRCWIKRGDFHAMHKEDVSYVRHAQEAQEVLQEYFLRGIKRAVINRHLEGDLIKFYGVQDTDFFFWFYPFDSRDICQRASEVLDVKIYGGDCIVGVDGSINIIDFNDWPSFAPCRVEAAPYIAKAIIKTIKQRR